MPLDVRCPDHLESVKAFAASIGKADQLQKQLDFLEDYGNSGLARDDPARRPIRAVLRKDFAPHSFVFEVYSVRDGEERLWFHGGLVFQSREIPANGAAPSFTVSLAEGTGWFIHT